MTLRTERLSGLLASLGAALSLAACLAPDAVPAGSGDTTGGGGSEGGGTTSGGAPGSELRWARSYGTDSTEDKRARSVVASPQGNVIIAGDFRGSLTLGSLAALPGTAGHDAFVAQLDASGKPAWSLAFAGPGEQLAYGAAATSDGGVVVAGSFTETLSFAGKDEGSEPQGEEGFIASLDAQRALRWLVRVDGSGNQAVHAVALAPDGGVVIAGTFGDTLRIGDLLVEGDLDGLDFFVAKLDAAGKPLWAKSLGATPASLGPGEPTSFLAIDGEGDIHVAGTFSGTLRFGENLGAMGEHDVFVGKLDAAGEPLWGHAVGADGQDQRAAGLAVDSQGRVILAGDLRGKVAVGGPLSLRSDGDAPDAFLLSYDDTGELVWARRYGSAAPDGAGAVAVDAAGDILFTGRFRGAISFGKETVLGNGGAVSPHDDLFLAMLTRDGEPIFSAAFGADENQLPTSIAVDASGDLLLAGYFGGIVDFGGGDLDAKTGDDVFVAKFGK